MNSPTSKTPKLISIYDLSGQKSEGVDSGVTLKGQLPPRVETGQNHFGVAPLLLSTHLIAI